MSSTQNRLITSETILVSFSECQSGRTKLITQISCQVCMQIKCLCFFSSSAVAIDVNLYHSRKIDMNVSYQKSDFICQSSLHKCQGLASPQKAQHNIYEILFQTHQFIICIDTIAPQQFSHKLMSAAKFMLYAIEKGLFICWFVPFKISLLLSMQTCAAISFKYYQNNFRISYPCNLRSHRQSDV